MATAIEWLLQDRGLCDYLGRAGQQHVAQAFTLDQHLGGLSRFLILTHAMASISGSPQG